MSVSEEVMQLTRILRVSSAAGTMYYTVDPRAFTYMLINAVKEQQALLQEQQALLGDLQQQINALHAMIEALHE